MAQIDLAPTLLELVGASSLPDAMGASVLGWWRGNVGPPERPAFSEAWFQSGRGLTPRGKAHRIANGGPIRAMTTRRHRLIEKRPRETVPAYELYSLEQDREERRDVARIAPRATARLAADLKAFLAAAAAKRDELIARDRGRTGAPGAPTAPEIDAERIDRLRELGYID